MRRLAAFLLLFVATVALARGARSWRLDSIADPAERRQVARTLEMIERGGPFAHAKDGSIFGNFERRLPPRPRGYYREYTVPTPHVHTRGARRIISGRGGEAFYTRDHYVTFVRLDE